MKYKLFGTKTGLYASELILGAGLFGTRKGNGTIPEDAAKILSVYADAGGNMIDISDQYQLGEAEEIVGKFIAHKRSDYIVCTKYTRSSQDKPAIGNMGNHRKAMIQAVEMSLKRLKTDHIDVYMPHYDDGVTPPEEIARGLDDLVRSGKVLYPGLANFPAWKAAAVAGALTLTQSVPLSVIQFEYNLLQRNADRELLPMAQHFGLAPMMYSPLAGGLLTGKYRNGESGRLDKMPGSAKAENESTKAIIDQLLTIAEETHATPGQVTLAWVINKRGYPIIGARKEQHIIDGLKAVDVKLTAEHIAKLDGVSAKPLGYPHDLLATVQKPKEF